MAHAQHILSATQAAVAMPDLIAAVRWPLLAASVSAAAGLLISIPVSANLARRSRRQAPSPQLGPSAAPAAQPTSDSVLPAASDGEANGQSGSQTIPAVSSGGEHGPAQQLGEDAMSETSKQASYNHFASEADSVPQTSSDTERGGEVAGSTNGEQTSPEQQLPGTSPPPPEVDPKRRKGFFRDIESDCLSTCRQAKFACGPIPHIFGYHRVARTRRQRPASSRMQYTFCLGHDSMCRHNSLLR